MQGFTDSLQHILAELERLDLLIQAAVGLARRMQGATDEFQGLYIPEEEVDILLSHPAGLPRWAMAAGPTGMPDVRAAIDRIAAGIAQRKADCARAGIKLRLDELARLYELTPFDTDALLICLAPEIDLRYERLYAYLQDDITKKRPSVDLVLNLLSPSFEAKLASRQRFAPQAPLVKHGLLALFDDPSQQQPPLLSKYLKVDERVVSYLFESDETGCSPAALRAVRGAPRPYRRPAVAGRSQAPPRRTHAGSKPVRWFSTSRAPTAWANRPPPRRCAGSWGGACWSWTAKG